MNEHWPMTEHVVPHWANASKRKIVRWPPEDLEQLEKLWFHKPPYTTEQIADMLGRDEHCVYQKARSKGWPGRREIAGKPEMAPRRKKRTHRADPTGQRRKTRVAASNGPNIVLEPHDPRFRLGTTVFPTSVIPASRLPRLLKSGHNSYKIGKTVAKGRLRGAPIFTLTLVERETCPRTCPVWDSCYGNNMPFAHRIHDDGTLTKRLWGELASIAAANPAGFLVRLHVLGDFKTVEYVEFWRQALNDFPALNIFGFTARRPPEDIGCAIAYLVRDFGERFRVRFSGTRFETDSAVVIDKPEDAIGILCPAEQDPDRSCATCGLCWHTNRTISFLRH